MSRPRLIERLNAGLLGQSANLSEGRSLSEGRFARKLTPVSAPAGFGKATLMSEWVAGCKRPVVWHSLDKSDNDPTHLRRYAIVAWHSWPLGDCPHTPTFTGERDGVELSTKAERVPGPQSSLTSRERKRHV